MTDTAEELAIMAEAPVFWARVDPRDPHASPWDQRGFEIGAGWHAIVRNMAHRIEALGAGVRCHQVKEKFGILRVYVDRRVDGMAEIIAEAEAASAITCEECGQPGTMRRNEWMRTRCHKHRAIRAAM